MSDSIFRKELEVPADQQRDRTDQLLLLLHSALRAAANAIVITDPEGKILWVNPAFTRLTGYPESEALGQKTSILKSGEHPKEFYQGLWSTISAGKVWWGEMQNRRRDGSLYFEEMTITPLQDSQGKITHFIAVKQNVTERKEMEQRLLRAQRMEGIGLLAGGIAHDLNNVLAPMLMAVDLLKTEPISEEGQKLLATLASTARRGADIVRQVLTFARGIEGNRTVLEPAHLVREMAAIMRETFPKTIEIRESTAKDLWQINGDPTQLHQVLLNLCVNSRDAMPEGGMLRLDSVNRTVDEAFASTIPGATPGNYVEISVTDTGCGIAPTVMEHLFEPFFTTKEYGMGSGLGLSTVMGIVRSHGGFLQAKSEVGHGARFTFYIPAVPVPVKRDETKAPDEVPCGHGELVLVVDDEESVREVTAAILERNGYRAVSAADGATGVAVFAQRQDEIAVVLTDILMPYMDGVAMVRAIQRLKPKAVFLATTGAMIGGGVEAKLEDLKRMGVRTVLVKPYTNEQLLRSIHQALLAPGTY